METNFEKIEPKIKRAVIHFWQTRRKQALAQGRRGVSDRGSRCAVTGGAQMNGFCQLIAELIGQAGVPDANIFHCKSLDLPGYYRPTKKWDMLVVVNGHLLVVLETKSQVGPSFGNNFNNRVEEAVGSATDFWTAYREGAFAGSIKPWLGYLFLLEECPRSLSPVKNNESHYPVFKEFKDASYAKRYELFCQKLLRERLYDNAVFLSSNKTKGIKGDYREPSEELSFKSFATSLISHVAAFAAMRRKS